MAPRALRSDWPIVDTIYCEAKCPDEDVYYFGSDDDEYESPRERKRRYELAGQRFLAGCTPRLFSASLRGPFESNRGWKNPWASKSQSTRIARQPERQIPNVSKALGSVKTTKGHVQPVTAKPRFDISECHLPSPQSLKTASLASDGHPFLEDAELQTVQAWRHNVRLTEPDSIQRSTPQATDAASSRKRKASHSWLKTVPSKRSRCEQAQDAELERPHKSLTQAPSIPEPVGAAPTPRFSPQQTSTSQLISPRKESSATRKTPRSAVPTNNKLSDELGRVQQAVATLSSPVSLRNVKQENLATELSPLKFKSKADAIQAANPERSGATIIDTTATHCTASSNTVRKPYRVPDDEDFVFDIALNPASESDETEEGETGQEEATNDARLEDVHHESSVLNRTLDDDIPDSELSDLSDSPELSDLQSSTDESQAEPIEALDDADDDLRDAPPIIETEMMDVDAAIEAMETTDDSHVKRTTEVDSGSDSEDISSPADVSASGVTVISSKAGKAGDATVFYPAPEGETSLLGSNESPDVSHTETRQLPLPDAVESEAELNTFDLVCNAVVAKAQVGPEPRVTAEPSTQSGAENVVLPSPKVKQESSDFSLRAIFRSLVPTNTWAQLTHLATGPAQSTQRSNPSTRMEEQVLPSVEDVSADNQEGSMTASTSDNVSTEEANGSFQQLCSEQDNSVILENLPTPQPRASETSIIPTCQKESTLLQQDDMRSNESIAVKERLETDTEATPAPSAAACKMLPPAATPAAPSRDKTLSPPGEVDNSEPRFAFKSFAAFTTPSPERLRITKRRGLPGSSLRHPSLRGIMSSGNAGSARRTSNRISWLLPGDCETEVRSPRDNVPSNNRAPSSPPPRTPLAELPTASNEKFAKHFSSVVKRTDGLRHRFHVSVDTDRAVECLASSQSSSMMAKGTIVAVMKDTAVAVGSTDVENQNRPREATMSVEPMDMVEDMVREMGDFWQAWDVDAELNAAKRAQAETAATGSQSQPAWR